MKTRWKLFTYPLMDIKAAEAMLNAQGAQGWQLNKIWFRLLACFEPARTPVTYCIDWADPIGDEYEDYVTCAPRRAGTCWMRRGACSTSRPSPGPTLSPSRPTAAWSGRRF